ncbi:MAG: UDP-2,3-diacylglucosamine diphosphatase [Gammaproteobacteria bacterium]|nr:UDP-2,3-diacylglucosamine diphosphatase [Gammaproteobacteria bacterium]
MSTLFISDTHLTGQRPLVTTMVFDFLRKHQAFVQRLYILGDFFEAWLGDDAVMPDQQAVIEQLAALNKQGIDIFIMHGNRDFLLGAKFEEISGTHLIAQDTIVDLYGTRVLLAHGDALCTDDVEYQAFRSMVRDPRWQQQALALPIAKRIEMAAQYRTMSKSQTGLKPADIMDVNTEAVENLMRKHQVRYLIHGHTHRPAIHSNNGNYRVVLGDWLDAPSALFCDAHTWQLQDIRVTDTQSLTPIPSGD